MTNYPQKQPPRFVPTLTQTVEHVAAAAPDTPAQPAALRPESPPVTDPSIDAQAVPPPWQLLEEQLEKKISTLVAKRLSQLEQEIHEEIKSTIRQVLGTHTER